MPEAPAVPDHKTEFSLPQAVPLRDGEEKYAATINLEDARRKASEREQLLAELRKELENPATAQTKLSNSKSARARQLAIRNKVAELQTLTRKVGDRWEGPCAPATVINLNPVALTLQGELARFTVPVAGAGLKINLKFRGRAFTASYVTFSTPHVWFRITGTENDAIAGIGSFTGTPDYIPPIGLAHQFFAHYVEGAEDAQYMGGILIFEGDIHTLEKIKPQGSVLVPWRQMAPDGSGNVSYGVEEKSLDECLEKALTQQRRYAESVIAEGHRFATSQADDIRNQLNNYHRLWHNWAMDRGYKETAEPWASERLQDSPGVQAIFCPDCRQKQTSPEQFFCPNCNAPFDACKAYLAGKVVSPDRLAVYDETSEQFKLILAENKRRRARIALLEETPTRGKKAEETRT